MVGVDSSGASMIRILLVAGMICAVGGCAAEQKEKSKYVETPAVLYEGMKGQSCAVMVWADWRTRTEYGQIQLDVGKKLTAKLEEHYQSQKETKKPEGAVHFTNPASVVRYQREH